MSKKLIAKPIIKEIYAQLKDELKKSIYLPNLAIILIGDDPAALFYAKNLEKKGAKIRMNVTTYKFADNIRQKDLLDEIELLNEDDSVNGIIVQKPLPVHLDESEIILKIDPNKDVDAFHPFNMGNLVLDGEGFIPSTSAAVIEILKFYDIEVSGKNVVILGRSHIVGKPLANLLLRKSKIGNATVTVCHSYTNNLPEITKRADILIAAIGKPLFVKSNMIKENAIIIDVGINQIQDAKNKSRYVGDVDFDDCLEKALLITPVPGGVGSVTTAMLLKNVVYALKRYR
ncbi:MAG: bifunctional 5,10-methylenetetrahydrofolate dehydrogenase/5,10-methenyltetrahydrofolate cyclohydrolase [Armatimonadetes bacterium]|nr:bifunctional 5,10-methylenetetrahydrofolate dehydrogenase/5,10-methenyltetrahydrofolate cyclohydrolase [Armatimonadota bacterium]